MGRRIEFFASYTDLVEVFNLLKELNLPVYISAREEREDGFYWSYHQAEKVEDIMRKFEGFLAKESWPFFYYRSGAVDSTFSEVIQFGCGVGQVLGLFGIYGASAYINTCSVNAAGEYRKKSEDFYNTYEKLARFIKKHGMIDTEKRRYILPDAYRIFCENIDAIRNTVFEIPAITEEEAERSRAKITRILTLRGEDLSGVDSYASKARPAIPMKGDDICFEPKRIKVWKK